MANAHNSNALSETSHLQQLGEARVAVVHTEWNDAIVTEQIKGCRKILDKFSAVCTDVVAVPGSFELPFGCRHLYSSCLSLPPEKQPEAIIAFGAVIRGGTPHFDYVCKAVTDGLTSLNLTLPIPVVFGVLTLDTETQAWERLGGPHGHKGEEAALTALKMIHFCRTRKS